MATQKPSATCGWCPTAPPIWVACAPCPRTHAQPRTTKKIHFTRARTPHTGYDLALLQCHTSAAPLSLLPRPQCRCADMLSPQRQLLPCTQHGLRRGQRHARPPHRSDVLTLSPLPRMTALARPEHSPTRRERVGRSIAVMASAWRRCERHARQHAIRGFKVPGTSVLVNLRYVCGPTLASTVYTVCSYSSVRPGSTMAPS